MTKKKGQNFKFNLEALLKGLHPVIIDEVLEYNRELANQIKSNKNKAFSKAIIFKFLYEYKNQLNPVSVTFIKSILVNLIPRLYLDKKSAEARSLSLFVIKNFFNIKIFFYVLYCYIFGEFNQFTNKGYRFLKIKYQN